MGNYTKPKNKLKELYGHRDMLTLIESDILAFHHLIKKALGGKDTVDNGALLEESCHEWLHSLEEDDPELFDLINECLKLYKICLDLNKKKTIKFYKKEVAPIVIDLVSERDIKEEKKKLQKELRKNNK